MRRTGQSALRIVPVTFRRAGAFVASLHRHHKPPRGMKYCLGVESDAGLCGVAMVGRPGARALDRGDCAEVIRTCTDQTPNANSALYGAAWRAGSAMGYLRMVTYTEAGESGVSLRAAGWRRTAELAPRANWAQSSVRLRAMRDPDGRGGVARTRWEIGPHMAAPLGGEPKMERDKLPRIQDMRPGPYYCGVLVCTGCGETVAICHCRREAVTHFCESCPACAPDNPAVRELTR